MAGCNVSKRARHKLDSIIDEAMHRFNSRKLPAGSEPAAPTASSMPPLSSLGILPIDMQIGVSEYAKVEDSPRERSRLPPLICMSATRASSTSPPVAVVANPVPRVAIPRLPIEVGATATWRERTQLPQQEIKLEDQEAQLQALGPDALLSRRSSASRRQRVVSASAEPKRSILAVSIARPRDLSHAARRHARVQRRKQQGTPRTISFALVPRVQKFEVVSGNRLHGLPAGAIRSTNHLRRIVGLL